MTFRRKLPVPGALLESPLADALPRSELRELSLTATSLNITQGRKVIAENAPGRECFVVIDGEFSVTAPEFQGKVGAGEVAGELALLTGHRRNASVTAASDASVYVLTRREFSSLLDSAPEFRNRVVCSASQRLKGRDSPLRTHLPWSRRLAELPAWSSIP